MQRGWTVGAGIEQVVVPGWTVFLEYDYLSFGSATIGTPESIVQTVPGGNVFRNIPDQCNFGGPEYPRA